LLIAVLSLGVGPYPIAPSRIWPILQATLSGAAPNAETTIVWQLRLPRLLLACFVGAGLGTAGAGYQGLFRNPLADPFVIGASGGAALGATLAIIYCDQSNMFGLTMVPIAALAGALLAVGTVYGIASVGRQLPVLSLLLAGITLSSLLGSLVSLLMFLNDEKLPTIFGWLMGSLSGRGWANVATSVPLILAGSVALWLRARSLDALTFGEETAASLGLNLASVRGIVVISASITTGACVAAGGIIGFIGLIAPHIARSLVGAQHTRVIPTSGLVGALLLLVADDLARVAAAPAEIPVGIVTAMLGSPFFLYLLKSRQRELGVGQ
jgi:iron complex transport system permease protein